MRLGVEHPLGVGLDVLDRAPHVVGRRRDRRADVDGDAHRSAAARGACSGGTVLTRMPVACSKPAGTDDARDDLDVPVERLRRRPGRCGARCARRRCRARRRARRAARRSASRSATAIASSTASSARSKRGAGVDRARCGAGTATPTRTGTTRSRRRRARDDELRRGAASACTRSTPASCTRATASSTARGTTSSANTCACGCAIDAPAAGEVVDDGDAVRVPGLEVGVHPVAQHARTPRPPRASSSSANDRWSGESTTTSCGLDDRVEVRERPHLPAGRVGVAVARCAPPPAASSASCPGRTGSRRAPRRRRRRRRRWWGGGAAGGDDHVAPAQRIVAELRHCDQVTWTAS